MSHNAANMVELAQRYCALIEVSSVDRKYWLQEVAEVLPLLHAAVTSLNGRPYNGDATLTPDLDARFELFSHLRELLGDRDGYWLEFDHIDDSNAMTGSLADDLTDIYCELKHGLRLVESEPELAVEGWLNGFENHWGRHLADAERHLTALSAQRRLD